MQNGVAFQRCGARSDNDFKFVFVTALRYHMQINVLSGVEFWLGEAKTKIREEQNISWAIRFWYVSTISFFDTQSNYLFIFIFLPKYIFCCLNICPMEDTRMAAHRKRPKFVVQIAQIPNRNRTNISFYLSQYVFINSLLKILDSPEL